MARPSADPFDLHRFVAAQADSYGDALAEVTAGRKQSHWMWYVFPQLAGLGHSDMARRYAIRTPEEAAAYLAHPVLGTRLVEISEAALAVTGRSAHAIFGSPDDLKLHSSATLFAGVSPAGSVFHRLLERFFAGKPDDRTQALLGSGILSGRRADSGQQSG